MNAKSRIGVAKQASLKLKIGLTVLCLMFIAGGSFPLYHGVQGIREARASLAWPKTGGKITQSHVATTTSRTRDRDNHNRERIRHSYSAEIKYEFPVNGVTHKGSRVTVVNDQFGSEDYAKAVSDKYPQGADVTVSYNPADPSDCVLEPGSWSGSLVMFAMAAALMLVPLLFLRGMWQSSTVDITDPHRNTKEERRRFGREFRERFLEWEPGHIIHLHRDHLGFATIIGGALIAGLVAGLLFGLVPALWLFSGRGPLFIAQFYAAVSLVLAVVGGIWLGLDNRRRDTHIDWGREMIRAQVGWFAHEYTFDEIQELSIRVPKPEKKSAGSGTTEKTYAARIHLHIGGKRYILLETEFTRHDHLSVRASLLPIVEQLAQDLKVGWSEK
ncbi:MAG: DUF3592 domain-containing protein [Planctomycetales bacterium]|nr:DUF3592 domain-containing protein [Planctomycetales bacterium]